MILIVLLVGTLAPFFAVYNPQPTDVAKELSELFGGKILICTGDGFKWINIAELEQEKEHTPSNHYKCPLCYIAANTPNATLSGDSSYLLSEQKVTIVKALYYHYSYLAVPKSIAANIQSRAPPFLFVS